MPFKHPTKFAIGRLTVVCLCLTALTTGALAEPSGKAPPAARLPLMFACRADNDLYSVLSSTINERLPRCDSAVEAVEQAAAGTGVLILADGYPERATPLDAELFSAAARKNLRLYVEYPAFLPGQKVGAPERTPVFKKGVELTRAVVTSDAFGAELSKLRILSICGTWRVPAKAEQSHLALARVVGLDTAVLGLPKDAEPLLFELPKSDANGPVLVSTSKLSQFVTARYAPVEAWSKVWPMVFKWLAPNAEIPTLRWTPTVRPSFTADEPLPNDALREAVRRGADHYTSARFLVHPSWKNRIDKLGEYEQRVEPAPTDDMPIGDGSLGMIEAFNATIDHLGKQPARYFLRADCNSESAMAIALRGVAIDDPRSRTVAANLQDFVYFHSNLQQGPRADLGNAGFGLLGWDTRSIGVSNYYGDDSARALLATIATAGALKSDRWDEAVLRSILGNFRTTGRLGFRGNNLLQKDLDKDGWQKYFDASPTNFAPHFEAYPWACYLWLYHKTGFTPLLTRSKEGIRRMMAAYPDQWRWTNGIQQERARMLLPLAWLVRVENTPEHRAWLERMYLDIAKNQVESGAIRDEIGAAGKGFFEPPKKNEAYGTDEAPLIQKNGDPICDLLYTTNFALLGLNEAAAATGDPRYAQSAQKLADFLCRIQVRSEKHPELDGAWFRAFDFGRWDYWASNSDYGWGVWSTETGWTQGWIAGVLGMRLQKTSLWELTANSQIGRPMKTLRPQMIPDDALLNETIAKGTE